LMLHVLPLLKIDGPTSLIHEELPSNEED